MVGGIGFPKMPGKELSAPMAAQAQWNLRGLRDASLEHTAWHTDPT